MTPSPVYQHDPDKKPDAAFEPGDLRHLVPGNRGRMLDPRRTPVSVVEIRPETGEFCLRIDAFEDRGALWTVPFENVDHYQFEPGATAPPDRVQAYAETASRLNVPLHVAADPVAGAETLRVVDRLREAAMVWIQESSTFAASGASLPPPETRAGDPRLWADTRAYFEANGLWELEAAFSRQFVSNPYSGEMVKGHRIVMAEMGLVAYEGKAVRSPDLFSGSWTKDRRREYVMHRMAYVQAVFQFLGFSTVTLYRGLSAGGALESRPKPTFVSTTFDRAVARAHFESAEGDGERVLLRRTVPVDLLFMTYYETEAMNQPFQEAEAAVLFEEGEFSSWTV